VQLNDKYTQKERVKRRKKNKKMGPQTVQKCERGERINNLAQTVRKSESVKEKEE
jgi:hypothetical protein